MLASDGVTVLANNQNSASDGKNASLAFTAPITGTYLLRVASTSGSGEYTLMVGPGILVEQLYVNSTFWQPVFRDYLDGGFNDGTAAGFPVPFGYSSSIPWLGLNEIKMRFNSDVGNSLSASDFILTGRLGFDSNLAPGQVADNHQCYLECRHIHGHATAERRRGTEHSYGNCCCGDSNQ